MIDNTVRYIPQIMKVRREELVLFSRSNATEFVNMILHHIERSTPVARLCGGKAKWPNIGKTLQSKWFL
jgi:hypothetical protein